MGDSIIGFPISMEIPLLGFNKQILKDNGYMSEDGVPTDEFLEKVKTWTGFREVALDLTDATTDPSKPVSGTGMLLADYYLFLGNWMKANGDKLAKQAGDRPNNPPVFRLKTARLAWTLRMTMPLKRMNSFTPCVSASINRFITA